MNKTIKDLGKKIGKTAVRHCGWEQAPLNPPSGGKRSTTKKVQRIGYGTFSPRGGVRGGFREGLNPTNLVNLIKITVQTN